MADSKALFDLGDRVEYVGQDGGTGTILSRRETERGTVNYRIAWDDGVGDFEFGEDELRAISA